MNHLEQEGNEQRSASGEPTQVPGRGEAGAEQDGGSGRPHLVAGLARDKHLERVASRWQKRAGKVLSTSLGAKRVKDFLNGTRFGHPLHPALTDVPIGAWTATLVLDLLDRRGSRACETAATVALGTGLVGAGAAAMAGVADWLDVGRRQRSIGLLHAACNVAAVSAAGTSLWLRLRGRRAAGKALSAAGYALTLAGAYLGGHLVFGLGTQVDRNAYLREPEVFVPVMKEADLPIGELRSATLDGQPVLLYRTSERIYALADTCAHAGCSLASGRLEGDTLVCPCHGSTYRLLDGAVVHGPSPFPQPCFESRVRDGQIELRSAAKGLAT